MNVVTEITNRIVGIMEQGVVPWKKMWLEGSFSHATGKPYTGINRLLLPAGEWATFHLINEEEGHVIKGSKSSIAVFCKPPSTKRVTVETPIETLEETEHVPHVLKGYSLFEVNTQAEGITPKVTKTEYVPNMNAEQILSNYEVPKMELGKAAFSIYRNVISMPTPQQFNNMDAYYSTLFHELIHSTGIKLKRFDSSFKEEYLSNYSREELTAELGAALLCHLCGIDVTIENSAAYIAHWKTFIESDERAIINAASKAEEAVKLILGNSALGVPLLQ
ncbi:MAG: DUF1738 domain-containing protein [Spirochaetia bacterium]|nr:DUF1738 domain-containing protein [Spirochaetia bacterium]